MKKFILPLILILLTLILIGYCAVIEIGSPADDRPAQWNPDYYYINEGVSATGSGTITSIEIWANTSITGCKVATFFVVSGNNLSTRDSVTIGAVAQGAKRTFTEDSGSNPIALEVQTGDYLGMYYATGKVDISSSGGAGMWHAVDSGDNIPYDNVLFTHIDSYAMSLYGTGITVEEEANTIWFGMNF